MELTWVSVSLINEILRVRESGMLQRKNLRVDVRSEAKHEAILVR